MERHINMFKFLKTHKPQFEKNFTFSIENGVYSLSSNLAGWCSVNTKNFNEIKSYVEDSGLILSEHSQQLYNAHKLFLKNKGNKNAR
jgi:hypothetical protein